MSEAGVRTAKAAARATDVKAAGVKTTKSAVHWALRQGVLRGAFAAAGRSSNPVGQLLGRPSMWADPYEQYALIRASAPIVAGPLTMATARHDVISELVRREDFATGFPHDAAPRAFRAVSDWAVAPEVRGFLERPSMLVMDGPDHARYRRLVSKAFTARAIAALRGRIEEISHELADRMDAKGGPADTRADIHADFAAELPVYVICEMLGAPAEERASFHAWARAITPLFDFGQDWATFRRADAAIREIHVWLADHLEHLRREPGPNLLSAVVAAGAEDAAAGGPGLSRVELVAIAGMLLGAGFETTLNLLGNGTDLLLRHPDALAELRADPAGWRNAVEEILRFESPIQNTVRHPLQDTEVQGVRIPRARFVICLLGGANRDPAVFADPDAFDIHRANARDHLAFSAGSHFCLGAALARMEGEVGLRVLFERFPGLAAAGPPRRRPTRNFRGYDRMPVALRGAASTAARAATPVPEAAPARP